MTEKRKVLITARLMRRLKHHEGVLGKWAWKFLMKPVLRPANRPNVNYPSALVILRRYRESHLTKWGVPPGWGLAGQGLMGVPVVLSGENWSRDAQYANYYGPHIYFRHRRRS